jgi:hypothetical protein
LEFQDALKQREKAYNGIKKAQCEALGYKVYPR